MKIKHLLKLKNEDRTISGPITPAPPGPSQELNQTFPTTVTGAPETSQTFPTKAKSPQTGQTVSSTDDDFDKFKASILGTLQTFGKGDRLTPMGKKPSGPSVGTIEKNLQNLSIQESIMKLDEISRRDFLKGAGAAAIGAMMPPAKASDKVKFKGKYAALIFYPDYSMRLILSKQIQDLQIIEEELQVSIFSYPFSFVRDTRSLTDKSYNFVSVIPVDNTSKGEYISIVRKLQNLDKISLSVPRGNSATSLLVYKVTDENNIQV